MFRPSSPLNSPIIKLRKFALSRGSQDSSDFEDGSANNSPIEAPRPSSPAPGQRLAALLSSDSLSPIQLRQAYLKQRSKVDREDADETRIISANYYKSPDSELIRFYTAGDSDTLHGSLILESSQEKNSSSGINGFLPRKIIQSRPQRDGLISTFVPFISSSTFDCFRSMPGLLTDEYITSTYSNSNTVQSLNFTSPLSFDYIVILAYTIYSRPQRSVIPPQQKYLFTQLMWNGIQWLAGPRSNNPPVSPFTSLESNYSLAIFPPGVSAPGRHTSLEAPSHLPKEGLGYSLETDNVVFGRASHHSPISFPPSNNSPLSPEDALNPYFNGTFKSQPPLRSHDQSNSHRLETGDMGYPCIVSRSAPSSSPSGIETYVSSSIPHHYVPNSAQPCATRYFGHSHSPIYSQVDTVSSSSPLDSPVESYTTSGDSMKYVKDNFGRELRDFHYDIIQRQKKSDRNGKMHSFRQERMQKDTENRNRVVAERLESMVLLNQEKERLARELAELNEQIKNARIQEGDPNVYAGTEPARSDRNECMQQN